jgi:RNA ligase
MELWELLSDRYVMYGEWLYAKHTVFYTDLPHYFMEFDIYDKYTDTFLSTQRRRIFLAQSPFVASVRVLHEGPVPDVQALRALIGRSHFISDDHLVRLQNLCAARQLDSQRALKETDTSTLMEGLYIKIEEEGVVKERYKYVRGSFLQTMFDAESHWLERPLIPNSLRAGVELF